MTDEESINELKKLFPINLTEEKLNSYISMPLKQRLEWLYSFAEFINTFQTPIERDRMNKLRSGEL